MTDRSFFFPDLAGWTITAVDMDGPSGEVYEVVLTLRRGDEEKVVELSIEHSLDDAWLDIDELSDPCVWRATRDMAV